MCKRDCLFLVGRLTDEKGNILCPYEPDVIVYSETSLLQRKQRLKRNSAGREAIAVSVSGYITIFADEKKISPPLPFHIIRNISLWVPKSTALYFQVRQFQCCIQKDSSSMEPFIVPIKILICIETIVKSKANIDLNVPCVNSLQTVQGKTCIYASRIYDFITFTSETCIRYPLRLLKAEVYQYNTLSDGMKRVYTDADELTEYGTRGILSPDSVSCLNVFVNGVLQPKANYHLTEGRLEFLTDDLPLKGQSVLISFQSFYDSYGRVMRAENYQYNAMAHELQSIYTNQDELENSDGRGIPNPNEVSYYNLYINGVLQPKATYIIEKGVLVLITGDEPLRDALIILESVVLKDEKDRIFRGITCQFHTYSGGQKIYLSKDRLPMYGTQKILAPEQTSYQTLFVNGVIQPIVNYQVREGCLLLKTEDSPLNGVPITLQSTCVFM